MNLRRVSLLVLLALPCALALSGCTSLKAIQILPGPGVEFLTRIGQTAQYTAIGASQMGSAIPTTSNLTGSVTWSVSNSNVATISSLGVVTAVGAGYTEILAQSNGVTAQSDLTVTVVGVTPTTPALSVSPPDPVETFLGETTQFTATGNLTGIGAPQNLTNAVQWFSSNVQVATINTSGLATAVGGGISTITAQSGGTIATGTLTVAVSASAPAAPTITIIPNLAAAATATFPGETTQFIAIGNLTGGTATQNLTNNVLWISSDVSVATIDQNGLATAVSANTGPNPNATTITAIGSASGGSVITATSVLSVAPGGGVVALPSLAVYKVGGGSGTVTSSAGAIVCGPQATCTGYLPLGSTVTLTATPAAGSVFGGWSANCVVLSATTCRIAMVNNEAVGAVFN